MLPIRAGERPFPVVAQSCSAPSVSRNCRIAAEQGQRTLHPGTEGRRTPLRGVLHQSPDAVGREREFERLDTEIRESGGDRVGDHTADGNDPAFPGALRPQRMIWRAAERSEEHTSELQSLMRISYAVFCLKKKKLTNIETQ